MAKENQYKSTSKKNEGHIADVKKTNKQKKKPGIVSRKSR